MKLSDYVVDFLARQGVRDVFLITGGVLAHLVHSFRGRSDIRYVCTRHEQAAAMAADGYARMTGKLGVAMATSGPGATNLITGIGCSWFDSIPVLCITGQVNTYESKGDLRIRQRGFQETDIVEIVKPITKYARWVSDPTQMRCELEKAVSIAVSGRPGPVLLDLPMNVQRAEIDPDRLPGYQPPAGAPGLDDDGALSAKVQQAARLLLAAERPIFIVGAGVRIAGARSEFLRLVETLRIPTVCSWAALDVMPHDHPLFVSQFGVYGSRAANLAVQNADCVVSVGSRLDTRMTGGKPETFARGAKRIVVDVDAAELRKSVRADVPVVADARRFLQRLNEAVDGALWPDFSAWQQRIADWKTRYPIVDEREARADSPVSPGVFFDRLSSALPDDAAVAVDVGANLAWAMQSLRVRGAQRVFSAFGFGPMGYSLPAAIGAAAALGGRPVVCIVGDGGCQMNVQELQTLAHYRFPVKVFVLNNRAYGLVMQFQEELLQSCYEATSAACGYSCPDFVQVARAYGLPAEKIAGHAEIAARVEWALRTPGPVVCEVMIDENARVAPKAIFGHPIEDQAPLLDREEFRRNMIVPPLE